VAISLVDVVEQMALDRIAKRYGIEMQEWPLPADEDVQAIVAERLTVLLEARLRDRDRLQIERMQRFEPLVHGLIDSEEGRALLTMLLDDHYQEALHPQALHASPDEPPSARPRSGSQDKRVSKAHRRRRRS
jgi:ATP-dependent RNA helicase DeaD